ncbi:hypothetical protein ACFVH6_14490 [Spirillospora sp. NPDC127200]
MLEDDGKLYELQAFYAVPDDAWSVELTDLTDGRPLAHTLIPDEDPGRPCQVRALEPGIPLEVLRHYLVTVAEMGVVAGRRLQ